MGVLPAALDLARLNRRQREAVTAPLGPLLVLAGPGTGKTAVLAGRIAHLVAHRGVDPRHVLAVTFTARAARELGERVSRLDPVAAAATIGTLHAFGFGLLRRWADRLGYDPAHLSVLDRRAQARVVRAACAELGLAPDRWPTDEVVRAISAWKRERGWEAEPRPPVEGILQGVARANRARNQVDFDDLITLPLGLLLAHDEILAWARDRYRAILVDEAQDLDPAQYRLLALLAGRDGPLTLVGDPMQVVYAWRGAALPLAALPADFPGLRAVALAQTYRSTATILEAASAIGALLPEGRRHLSPRPERGAPIIVIRATSDAEEASLVAREVARLHRAGAPARWGDCAVLYRAGWQGRAIERALARDGIPARRADVADLLRAPEVQDVLAHLRVAANPRDLGALARALDRPPRGLAPLARAVRAGHLHALDDLAALGPTLLVRPAARDQLRAFLALHAALARDARVWPPARLLEAAIAGSGHAAWLVSEEGTDRSPHLERLQEMACASAAPDLPAFLAEVAEAARAGHLPEADGVVLTTIHRAKGLEFDVVFLVGFADGILPHAWSRDDPERLAEEVRLAYVAFTRARDRLYLSFPVLVERDGHAFVRAPSPFLDLLPRRLLTIDPPR